MLGGGRKKRFINNDQAQQLIRFARSYLASVLEKSPQDWFVRKIWSVYNNTPRIYGCSVRYGDQVAIDAKGDIYPCVVFTGQKEYILGNVAKGDLRLDIFKIFQQNRINKIKDCKDCWARFLCGGGCIGLNGWYTNDISVPDMTLCNERKDTFKILMWLISELQEKAPDFFDKSFNLQGEKSAVITVSNNQRISEGIQRE